MNLIPSRSNRVNWRQMPSITYAYAFDILHANQWQQREDRKSTSSFPETTRTDHRLPLLGSQHCQRPKVHPLLMAHQFRGT